MKHRRLFSIAPDAPFLPTLADRVLDGTLLSGWPRTGPFWLADVTIVLPTRRARLALAEIFAMRGHGLLPDIRTFGGDAADEEPFLPPFEAPALPSAMPALERRLILSRLIAAWAQTPEGLAGFASPPHAAEIFWLADSLAELIDDLEIEGVSARALREVAPEALAANWQDTLNFLEIVLRMWPKILAERGRADAAPLRNERLKRQAETAKQIFGHRPVIAAGSTGSIPATATLLAAIAGLERGAIVLPGLDTFLSAEDHERLLDGAANPHGHPQYGLARLLGRIGSGPAAVTELATEPRPPRTLVLRRALALAEGTANWAAQLGTIGPAELAEATEGLAILAARTADEEARAIALAARDALARKRRVGIISPDRNLARRIAAELERYGIEVDDAAGTPLFQSAAGRMVRLILALATSDCADVDLMGLLRNSGARFGLDRAEIGRRADAIEMGLLRGQRRAAGLEGLHQALADNVEGRTERIARRLSVAEGDAVADLLDRIGAALAPLTALLGAEFIRASDLARTLGGTFAEVTAGGADPTPDALPGAREFASWVAELTALPDEGPAFAPGNLDAVTAALMAGTKVVSPHRRRDDVVIWGQLEARLQNPDLMILAGVNEGIWPEAADPGPWLSRGMRLAIGLDPPERGQGLAAHDFEMAMGNRQVLIAFAERLGTAPALPSRLVQRLEAFLGEAVSTEMRARGAVWRTQARALDAIAGEPQGASRPLPRPAAALRPRRLSVTEVETLFRSPYDLYAKHVLRLRKLAPLGEAPDARERGSMIHAVFARFIEEGLDFGAPDALARLQDMAVAAFAGLEAIGERRDIWLKRFSLAAQHFLDFERERSPGVISRHAEIDGKWVFPTLEDFTLTGRADRVDRLVAGGYEIIDFKTGAIPKARDMQAFEAPQLLLEAAMARTGALEDLPPGEVSALTYIKIGLGPEAFTPTPFKPADGLSLAQAADEVSRRMQGHVAALLLKDDLPLAARIRPDVGQRYRGDYDHLARTDEWTLAEGGEDE